MINFLFWQYNSESGEEITIIKKYKHRVLVGEAFFMLLYFKINYGIFTAGADLIITNTYQASVEGFMEHLGLTREQSYDLIVRAVELAKRARSLYLDEYQNYLENGKVIL